MLSRWLVMGARICECTTTTKLSLFNQRHCFQSHLLGELVEAWTGDTDLLEPQGYWGAAGVAPRREEVELAGQHCPRSGAGPPAPCQETVCGHQGRKEEFGQGCQGGDSKAAVQEALLGEEALDPCSLGKQVVGSPSHPPAEAAQKASDSGKVTGRWPLQLARGTIPPRPTGRHGDQA